MHISARFVLAVWFCTMQSTVLLMLRCLCILIATAASSFGCDGAAGRGLVRRGPAGRYGFQRVGSGLRRCGGRRLYRQ